MKMLSKLLLSVIITLPMLAQGITPLQVLYVALDPAGSCGPAYITVNVISGNEMACVGGVWTSINGGGVAGVTGSGTAGVIPLWTTTSAIGNSHLTDDGTTVNSSLPITASNLIHVITFSVDGAGTALATGDIKQYPTVAYSCTIYRIDISSDQTGSITVDVWKRAGAIPAAGNKISASAPLTLSSAQLAQNGSLTGWTTAVSSGDVFGFSIATAATVTKVTGQIWCRQ